MSAKKQKFETALRSHEVSLNDQEELFAEFSLDSLPIQLHMLAECMIQVSYIY